MGGALAHSVLLFFCLHIASLSSFTSSLHHPRHCARSETAEILKTLHFEVEEEGDTESETNKLAACLRSSPHEYEHQSQPDQRPQQLQNEQ